MKTDIKDKLDVQLLVDSFYDKVVADEIIGYLFNDVAKVDWGKHLPVMYSFWETIIFGEAAYKGNPMPAHMKLHQASPLNKDHFRRWLSLFHRTVDELFEGEKADLVKQRATSIATVMQIKILHQGIGLN